MLRFRRVFDALTRQKELEKAFERAGDMLKRDQYMFNEVCNALIEGELMRKEGKLKRKTNIVEILSREDSKINEISANIRKNVLEYLALNSSPDVGSSLILTSVVIDLERLGDYTKDLAKIALLKPLELEHKIYLESIRKWRDSILKMFESTQIAFVEEKLEKAHEVERANKQLRDETDKFLLKIDSDKKIRAREAILYTLYTRYFRRVAAHLENVATSIERPWPYTGFKKPSSKKKPPKG